MFPVRKASDAESVTSYASTASDGEHHDEFFKKWRNPCGDIFHRFHMRDLLGAPNLTSPAELLNRSTTAKIVLRRTNDVIKLMINTHFEGAHPDEFQNETAYYRIENLPILPKYAKKYFERKQTIIETMKELYRHLMFFTPLLNQVSLDNMLYPNKISKEVMFVEQMHMNIVCELEMTIASFAQPIPKDGKDEAGQFKMVVAEVRLMRCMRQYLIVRDYARLITFIDGMYRYFGKGDIHDLT